MDVRSETLLSGRKGLVVGIANEHSIAYGCARVLRAVAPSAGIVLGARVPIVLTSRADPREARIASCGVALVAARRPAQRPLITVTATAQAPRVPA